MINPKNIRTVTDLRERTVQVLEEVKKSKEPFIIFKRSTPHAVLISMKEFRKIIERLEDLYDEYLAKQLAKEPVKKKISLKEMLKHLEIDESEI